MTRRTGYAKGAARRADLIRQALELVAAEGYQAASIRAISSAAGLSPTGLLHYFDTKEDLFIEVLRERDARDLATFAPAADSTSDLDAAREYIRTVIEHNAREPGVVQLFSQLYADAARRDHPAHDYFVHRSAELQSALTAVLLAPQRPDPPDNGDSTATVHPAPMSETKAKQVARIVQSVVDGLQLQWLLDPTFDMAAVVDTLFELITTPRSL